MSVLEVTDPLITNDEVLAVLIDRHADREELGSPARPCEKKAFKYLSGRGAEPLPRTAIAEFVTAAKSLDLTPSDLVQVVNLRPATPVEAHVIVGSRLTEEQVEELLTLIARHLRSPIPEAAA